MSRIPARAVQAAVLIIFSMSALSCPILAQEQTPAPFSTANDEALSKCTAGEEVQSRIDACTEIVEKENAPDKDRADALVFRGDAYVDKADYDRAIKDYELALQLEPDNLSARTRRVTTTISRGDCQTAGRNCDTAMEQLSKLIDSGKLDDDDDDLYLALFFRGEAYMGEGDLMRSLRDYTAALKVFPGDPYALRNRSQIFLLHQGEYDKALADITNALRAFKDPAMLAIRGDVYFTLGAYDQAILDYEDAIRLDPQSFFAFQGRGQAYYAKHDYERAMQDFDAAIRIKADNAFAYYDRGLVHAAEQNYEAAIENYTQAVRLKPDFGNAFNNRGSLYAQRRDYDRAMQDFEQAVRFTPDNAEALNNRGTIYAIRRQYDLAIKDFDQAIQLKSDFAIAFRDRGDAYRNQKQYDRAVADYDQAIHFRPDYVIAFRNRAEAYFAENQYNRAIEDLDRAIGLTPNDARDLNTRCWFKAIAGDLDSALADCNQSLQIQRAAPTLDSRGLVYLKMENFDAAIADYNAALAINPKLADSLYGRGIAERLNGVTTASDEDIQAATKLVPDIAARFAKWGVAAPADVRN